METLYLLANTGMILYNYSLYVHYIHYILEWLSINTFCGIDSSQNIAHVYNHQIGSLICLLSVWHVQFQNKSVFDIGHITHGILTMSTLLTKYNKESRDTHLMFSSVKLGRLIAVFPLYGYVFMVLNCKTTLF
jgi:hypothetical protein